MKTTDLYVTDTVTRLFTYFTVNVVNTIRLFNADW